MSEPSPLPTGLNAAEFLTWSDAQADGRYELLDGEIVAMAPERLAHGRRKLDLCLQLRNAIAAANLPCEAVIDSVGVAPNERTVLIPDVLVYCGAPLDGSLSVIPNPIIIVEIASPSTRNIDTSEKLSRYLRLPSLHHYLIAQPTTSTIIHHARQPGGWMTSLVGPGPLRLDPPGFTLDLD